MHGQTALAERPETLRCPECRTPFLVQDAARAQDLIWCRPCGTARRALVPGPGTTPAPPLVPASARPSQVRIEEGGHALAVSWRTFRRMDVYAPVQVLWCAGVLGMLALTLPALVERSAPWPFVLASSAFGVLAILFLRPALCSLTRWFERVFVRVEGRTVSVHRGPFGWWRGPEVDGATVRRLRVVRERAPFLERGRVFFRHEATYGLVAELRTGEHRVLATGVLERAVPWWVGSELTAVLDLREPVDVTGAL